MPEQHIIYIYATRTFVKCSFCLHSFVGWYKFGPHLSIWIKTYKRISSPPSSTLTSIYTYTCWCMMIFLLVFYFMQHQYMSAWELRVEFGTVPAWAYHQRNNSILLFAHCGSLAFFHSRISILMHSLSYLYMCVAWSLKYQKSFFHRIESGLTCIIYWYTCAFVS